MNLLRLLEFDGQTVHPITFQVLPPLSRRFPRAFHQIHARDKSKWFRKHCIWHAGLILSRHWTTGVFVLLGWLVEQRVTMWQPPPPSKELMRSPLDVNVSAFPRRWPLMTLNCRFSICPSRSFCVSQLDWGCRRSKKKIASKRKSIAVVHITATAHAQPARVPIGCSSLGLL